MLLLRNAAAQTADASDTEDEAADKDGHDNDDRKPRISAISFVGA